MIEKLKNCPQCAGVLNDAGRCEFCGSKVYDFLTIDFNSRKMPSAKTYIRLKVDDKIVIAPVVIDGARIDIRSNPLLQCAALDGLLRYIPAPCYPEIELNLMVIGDLIEVDDNG